MQMILSFIRKHRVALTVIIIIQVLLSLNDAIGAINCHKSGSDCMPWLWMSVFFANFPFSMVIDQLSATLTNSLAINHYNLSIIIDFFLYAIGGSFWWLVIVMFIQWLRSILKKEKIGNA